MTINRTQLVAVFARNMLIALLVALLSRPAIAYTDPPVPANSSSSTGPARAAATDLPDAPTPREGEPTALHITILDGEGALNNIRQRTAREPIIQVEDQNHKPVSEVAVLFAIHPGATGAGASFNGLSTLSVKTGANGQAIGHGISPNSQVGSFTIDATATSGTLTATAVIHQENIIGGKKSNSQSNQGVPPVINHHRAVTWGIIGGAIIGITIILILDRNSGTNISLGNGGVGHP